MAESAPGTETPQYDRDFLLSPGKRNQVMALWEVEKFGTDSFGDPDYPATSPTSCSSTATRSPTSSACSARTRRSRS